MEMTGAEWKTARDGAERKILLMTIKLYMTPLDFKEPGLDPGTFY